MSGPAGERRRITAHPCPGVAAITALLSPTRNRIFNPGGAADSRIARSGAATGTGASFAGGIPRHSSIEGREPHAFYGQAFETHLAGGNFQSDPMSGSRQRADLAAATGAGCSVRNAIVSRLSP